MVQILVATSDKALDAALPTDAVPRLQTTASLPQITNEFELTSTCVQNFSGEDIFGYKKFIEDLGSCNRESIVVEKQNNGTGGNEPIYRDVSGALCSSNLDKTVHISCSDESPGNFNKEDPLSSRFKLMGFGSFLICGIASLICWQFLLSMIPTIENHIFSGAPIGNSILGTYQIGCIGVQLTFILILDTMRPSLIIFATLLDGLLAILLPLILSKLTFTVSLVLFHIVALLFGACAGMVSAGSTSLASAMPFNYVGAFSMGQGLCGIFVFLVNTLANSSYFNLSTYDGAVNILWLLFGISSAVSLLSALIFFACLSQNWSRTDLHRFEEIKKERLAAESLALELSSKAKLFDETPRRQFMRKWLGTTDSFPTQGISSLTESALRKVTSEDLPRIINDYKTLPSRGWRCILKASYLYLFCVFFNFLVTMNIFPRLGPIMFKYDKSIVNKDKARIILFGVFAIGDFIGKSLHDLSYLLPILKFLRMRSKVLLGVVMFRCIFIVFFVLGGLYSNHCFFNAFAWYVILMLAMAITSGWCATLAIIYASESVSRFEEKEVVCPCAVLCLLLGILCGSYSAYIY